MRLTPIQHRTALERNKRTHRIEGSRPADKTDVEAGEVLGLRPRPRYHSSSYVQGDSYITLHTSESGSCSADPSSCIDIEGQEIEFERS